MSDPIAALRASHDRLAATVANLDGERLTGSAYPSEWSIAQVLSHLGSGAEIMALAFDAALAGTPAPGREANAPIWDRWNARTPVEQAAQGIDIDRQFVALDPTATIGAQAVPFVVDGLGLVARFTGKGRDLRTVVQVDTTEPARSFVLTLGETVTLDPEPQEPIPDGFALAELSLPAEAFIRLVYGRLDPDHTPAATSVSGLTLDDLRRVFPGL
jgi:Mycothiol maleylpyruvate isomerase N-terminal domain